jgi:hypothetical protein
MRDRREGKLADITGPGITDRWGVTCADLGASVIAPNGTLVSVFGDTFSGNRVGEGDWRSPVILIGTGDACHPITYHRAGGGNPDFAQQLWRYEHRTGRSGRPRRGISTVIPSDLLRVGESLYLHAIVNRGVGLVVSQWNTTHGWPYRAMQFRATLHDTTPARHSSTLKSESPSSGAPSI